MDKHICTLLLLLSLLSVCVYSEGFALAPIELAPIPCNDKAVEKLSRLAVTYINEDRTLGYKFALNRVANVHLHAQGPAGNVYYLDLDVLETKCYIGSPKPWKRCDIRPFMETQISGNCNTTVLHTPEGYSYLYSYDCTLTPDPPEKLYQTCPTCPLLLPLDSQQAVDAARVTLASYKRQSTLGADLGVKEIMRASAQAVPVKASFVEYTVQECPEGVTERGTCERRTRDSDTETAGFCTGSVHGDLIVHPDVQVSCEMFKIQSVDVLRPVQPQGHDLPPDPVIPTFPSLFDDAGNDPQPVPSDPTLPPAVELAPFDPTPIHPEPFDPAVVVNPTNPLSSSSSESAEDRVNQQQQPPAAQPFGSSSEEIGGPVAMRPPFNFRYQRPERKKRQALTEPLPSHNPVFLDDFPSGPSPFRSCPGPSRYTTV
ncbi:Alpha-2-HS-glycoprotein Fetuin-A Precursor [Larimichthys crocea]|uniref:Alpha-2-HS-glycoprotein Fetuin-A n=1 Tax=Larimichthys crocea TaxID=215358 RepID=A0A6G0ITQ2_LARCR|nr:Alpha-2-HS-glycoprotein Fetuin-A Precursor [Larimichthys crocea]